jgi:endonuclease YncB( thermonuclease family)
MDNLSKEYNFKNYDIHTSEFTLRGSFLPGRLVDIIDGDSLVIILPVFDSYYKYHVRINGIDTCEMKSKNQDNKTLALQARLELLCLITQDTNTHTNPNTNQYDINITRTDIKKILNESVFLVYLECKDFDKYGRLLADVYTDHNKSVCLSNYLLDKHLAYVYTGATKLKETEQLDIMN